MDVSSSLDRWTAIAREAVSLGAMQKASELAGFLDAAAAIRPRTILEIGTCLGGTFWALAQVAEADALLISVDLPLGPFSGRGTVDTTVLSGFVRPGQRGQFFRGDSHDAAISGQVRAALPGPVDVLLIDGDHTYAGVKQDFEDYAPLVRHEGLVAFHDILPHSRVPSCQVDRFWSEIRTQFEAVEFVEPDHDAGWGPWGGIGVIRWRQ